MEDKSHLFKSLPCYQRMIHLINMHQLALQALHVALMKGEYKQYLWIDSTTLETLFSLLKGQYNLVTSKACSIRGFLSGIYASLCAYQLTQRNKPAIQIMESIA